jgi:hypothetical protein
MKSKGVYEKPVILITHNMTVCSEVRKKFEIAHLEQHRIIHGILSVTSQGCRNKVILMQIVNLSGIVTYRDSMSIT